MSVCNVPEVIVIVIVNSFTFLDTAVCGYLWFLVLDWGRSGHRRGLFFLFSPLWWHYPLSPIFDQFPKALAGTSLHISHRLCKKIQDLNLWLAGHSESFYVEFTCSPRVSLGCFGFPHHHLPKACLDTSVRLVRSGGGSGRTFYSD